MLRDKHGSLEAVAYFCNACISKYELIATVTCVSRGGKTVGGPLALSGSRNISPIIHVNATIWVVVQNFVTGESNFAAGAKMDLAK